jgi:hypothetical protein
MAASFHVPAVWGPMISTRRTIEGHGGPRRSFMALRADHSFSVVLRGSPCLRVESFALAAGSGGVLS